MPAVSPYNPKGYTNTTDSFPWKYVTGYTSPSASAPAKKVWMRNTDNNGWIEVWNSAPLINAPTITSANDGATATKLTITGTTDNFNVASSLYIVCTNTSTGASTTTSSVSFSASKGEQSYSIIIAGLAENTTYSLVINSSNDGGSSTYATSKTTNINCSTPGSAGWSSTTETDVCSTCDGCGTSVRYRTRYEKSGCTTSYSAYGSCSDCGTWSTIGPVYGIFQLTSGVYIEGKVFGWVYYNGGNYITCDGGMGLLGPGYVESCSVTGQLRSGGDDSCVYPA